MKPSPLSKFKLWYEPLRGDRKPYCVANYWKPSYRADILWLANYVRASTTLKNLRISRAIRFKSFTPGVLYNLKNVHIRWEWLVIAFLLGMLIGPGRAAGASTENYPSMPARKIAMAEKLPRTSLQPARSLYEVQVVSQTVSSPKPIPAVSGCVSGYATGNYYEDYIINHESRGNSCATNYLGCFGLMQACPGEPLKAACGGDPGCQIDWFYRNKVMQGYGSWGAVYQHEVTYGWW